MLRCAFGERGWVIPNERIKTGRSARKGLSRKGFCRKSRISQTARPGHSDGYDGSARCAQSAAFAAETRSVHN